ncbi:protocadherin gamma-B2-like [Bombina bombina]|uniref:protocadherin gamma-B2-like n=1 Tax=Bombina bombina TaxID=8345 RepID=UPI00235AA147|nr:protocadherin gamma-B2-like [Bombina bombina]
MKTQEMNICKTIRWQVICFFLMFWLFPLVSGALQYSVFEEMRKGSVVGNLATDLGLNIKELPFRKFRIASHVSEKYFFVNFENGNLYIKNRIDREALCGETNPCSLTFDAVVENPLNVFHVQITVKDINDNAPYFFHEIIKLEIPELTSPGARFVLQNARDPDLGINSLQSYKLSANKHFVLTEKMNADGIKFPEIVLDKSLDRETQSSFELVLTASDGGNPIKTGTALINVYVVDSNDNFPIFTQEVYKVTLNENIPLNSSVLFLKASDKDEGTNAQITYSFSSIPEEALQIFSIDASTGEIKTKGNIDFEVTKKYEMTVQAQDGGGLASHANVMIQIIDVNDNAPEITITSISSPFSEDSLPGTVVALINIHDKDSGENGEVTCLIKDALTFKLLSSSGNYYKIVTVNPMDREEISHYNIIVVATDQGSPTLSTVKNIQLEISDVNDNPPVFEKSIYFVYVPENNSPGASIYNIYASDIDAGENAKLTYSIINKDEDEIPVISYLSINPVTGAVYAQRSFDYEKKKEFYIHVLAKDNGFPPLKNNATLKICVVDQNDNSPRILYPSPESESANLFEMVPPSSEPGYLITKVVAVDDDSGHNGWLSYHFLHTTESLYFNIGLHTGEIRTARIFQEKDSIKQRVVIMVKDNGYPSLSATVTLNLVIADHFQEILPDPSNQSTDFSSQSNLQFYLVIAVAVISFLFMLTVVLVLISKYKNPKPSTAFNSLSTNLYSHIDPRFMSQLNNGTLPIPYSYDVCVALDSSENNFAVKPTQSVPVASLIDADDAEITTDKAKDTTNNIVTEVRFRMYYLIKLQFSKCFVL